MDVTSRWIHSDDHAHDRGASRRGHHQQNGCSRVCREAGARVKFNAVLRDMNLGVRGIDERRFEVHRVLSNILSMDTARGLDAATSGKGIGSCY